MASLNTTRTTAAPMGSEFLYRLVSGLIDWNNTRKTRNALSRLSDRQLEDIGLTRADIDRAFR